MKTYVTIEYMVNGKRKWLSRSFLAGIPGGVNENERGVNHNDLQTVRQWKKTSLNANYRRGGSSQREGG